MNTKLKNALKKVDQLDAKAQAELVSFIEAKAEEPYIMSEAEIAACEEGYKDSSRGIFAPEDALEKHLARLRSA